MSDLFTIAIPILKAYKDEDGNVYLRGLGGDAEPDFDPKAKRVERLSIPCIEDMKKQIAESKIPLIPRHWDRGGSVITSRPEWDDEMGVAVDAFISISGQIFPLIKLDMDNSKSQQLFKAIEKKKKKLGLSWGGKPIQWHTEILPDGQIVRVFDKIELWHFAVTTKPVNGRTLNNPLKIVAKSVDWETADTIETKSATQEDDYPDRAEVLAIYKSLGDGETQAEKVKEEAEKPDETTTKTKGTEASSMALTPEELKALCDGIGASIKAQLDPVLVTVKSVVDQSEKEKAEAAVKAQAEQRQAEIDAAVSAALKAAGVEPGKKETPAAKSEAELKAEQEEAAKAMNDAIAQAVNKALEAFMPGLKSKPAGDNAPGDAGEESEVLKAMKQLESGEKGIEDFPRHIQRKLEDFSAAAGMRILKSMPDMVSGSMASLK